MSHRWLIAVSMTAHLSIAGGLAAAGAWQIQRLDRPKLAIDLQQPLRQPPAPAGGPVAAVTLPEIKRKPHVTHDTVQPTVTKPPAIAPDAGSPGNETPGPGSGDPHDTGTCLENCGPAPLATAPVCGDGALDASEQCDDGNTLNGDGCSATCRIEVVPRRLAVVAPSVLQGLRLSGTTQVHPDPVTQSQMMRDGADRITGTVKLCISTAGAVTSATVLASTKYRDYDAVLLAAVRDWHYQPYALNGAAVPACSSVTFIYRIQ